MNKNDVISQHMSKLGKKSWESKTPEQKQKFREQAKKASEAAKLKRLNDKKTE